MNEADAGTISLESGSNALASGATIEALRHYRQASTATNPQVALAGELGVAVSLARQRQWQEAETVLTALTQRFPESGLGFAYLATVRFEQGNVAAAQEDFARAATLAPDSALVCLKHGEMLVRLGLLREGLSELQRAGRMGGLNDQTRDYARQLQLAVRRQLAGSLDRPVPRPFWQLRREKRPAAVGLTDLSLALAED